MDYGVFDGGVAISDLTYPKNRRIHAHQFIGRKNMLNSFHDAFFDFKEITLIINRDSIDPTNTTVDFRIENFEDGFIQPFNA